MSTSRKFAVTAIFGLGLMLALMPLLNKQSLAYSRTAAASVTRMAVFVQATAPRYDAYVDFECKLHLLLYTASSMLDLPSKK